MNLGKLEVDVAYRKNLIDILAEEIESQLAFTAEET